MSEKFEKIVNAPHRAFGRIRRHISDTEVTTKSDKALRAVGVGVFGLPQFLFWAAKYITLDNHLTRAGERALGKMRVGKNKAGQDKKLSAFAHKHPNLSSHILYYMMLAMVAGGTKVYYSNTQSNDDENATPVELTVDIDEPELTVQPNTYGAYLARVQPIAPYLIADLIAKEGVHVDPTTGLHTPYLDSNNVPTIGFGSTVLMDGSRVTMNTKPITTQEAFELARWHLNEETFFIMYCYDVAHDKVNVNTTREALGMGSVIYNSGSKLIESKTDRNHQERFAALRNDFKQYGYALPDSVVLARFAQFPIQSECWFGQAWLNGKSKKVVADNLGNYLVDGPGLYWRRWIEAGLITGDLSPEMLLDCPVNGIYEFFERMGRSREKFFTGNAPDRHVNKDTYAEFKKWLANPVDKHGRSIQSWKKVSDYMPADIVTACRNGKCELGNPKLTQFIPQVPKKLAVDLYVPNNDSVYNSAVAAFKKQDYIGALKIFDGLLKNHSDNALLHNDMAATCNNLGRYDDAIAHARQVIFDIGDKKQYAAAYYNAAVAYEKLGNLQKALANYKLAVANGNNRVQRDITRLTNKLNKGNNKNKKQKRISFNAGRRNIKNDQNSFIRKLNQHNKNTNGMA